MDVFDFSSLIPLVILTLWVNPTLAWFKAWGAEWLAYRRSGRFNFDGRTDTDDWASMRDPATGKKSLIRIAAYNQPKNGPGTGSVVFYTKNEDGGEERNQWRLMKWEENIENLSEVTVNQAAEITAAGNWWPQLPGVAPADPYMVNALDLLRFELEKTRRSREASLLKTAELLAGKIEAMSELATSNRDVARSLDSAGTKISNAGKKVAKAWDG